MIDCIGAVDNNAADAYHALARWNRSKALTTCDSFFIIGVTVAFGGEAAYLYEQMPTLSVVETCEEYRLSHILWTCGEIRCVSEWATMFTG